MSYHLKQILRFKEGVFPGPQPISIERIHFEILEKNDYVVSPKADGQRYLLVVKDNISVLINRAFEEEEVKFRYHKDAKLGTVLDVERVKSGKILVFDAYQVNGVVVKDMNLNERLEAAEKVVKGILKTTKDKVRMEMKPVFPRKEVEKAFLGEFEYETDGLIFTPVNEPIRSGTHRTMFKWKPRDKNTVDFQVVPSTKLHDCKGYTEYGFDLYVQEKGRPVMESRLPIALAPNHLVTLMERGISEVIIMECEYVHGKEHVSNHWRPILHRKDKNSPNSRWTFQRTMVNIEEDIKWQEFKK